MEINMVRPVDDRSLPWGFWATTAFTLLIIILFLLTELAVTIGFHAVAEIFFKGMDMGLSDNEGLLLGISTCVTAPVTIGFTLFLARIRRNISVKEYLGFFNPAKKQYFLWALIVLCLAFCSDVITLLLGKPLVSEFMLAVYESAGSRALLWFALLVASPLYEEIVFRGFFFKGIEVSPVGPTGAILFSSLGWAALHLQYDLYGMVTIFAGGLVFGIARLKTGSIFIPIMMHSIANFIATLETAIYSTGL
jgi:membrane protease YdiL (CAAX protease family)